MLTGWWSDWVRSVRYVASRPLVSSVIVVTMGVAVAAATLLFNFYLESAGDRYYQGPRDGRAFYVHGGTREAVAWRLPIGDFHHLRRELADVGDVYAWAFFQGVASLEPPAAEAANGVGTPTVHVLGQAVSAGHFEVFGASSMTLGRPLDATDDRPGSAATVVLDSTYWHRHFGADPTIVGRVLRIDGRPFTIVGVAPAGFLGQGMSFNAFIPLTHLRPLRASAVRDDRHWVDVFQLLHLRPGVERAEAATFLQTAFSELDRLDPLPSGEARVGRLRDAVRESGDDFGDSERMLLATVLLLFALATVNVAHLLWVGALERRPQWTVMRALGAPPSRLWRRPCLESLCLALPAGALGLAAATGLSRRLADQLSITPTGLGGWSADMDYMPVDGTVIGFAVALTLGLGLGMGWLSAAPVVGRGSMLGLRRSGAGLRRGWDGRRTVVVLQVALSAALLVAGILMQRSLAELRAVHPGFHTDGLAIAALRAVPSPSSSAADLYEAARRAVAALPGVDAATLVSEVPGTGNSPSVRLVVPGHEGEQRVPRLVVGTDFFTTFGIDGIEGELFSVATRDAKDRTVVVDQAFVERFFPSGDAVGRSFRLRRVYAGEEDSEVRVVGVVKSTLHQDRRRAPQPLIYLPRAQLPATGMSVVARTTADPAGLLRPMGDALRALHADLALVEVDLYDRHLAFSLYMETIFADLSRGLATAALLLAVSGIFAVMSCLVAARRRELGIRCAVGAERRDLVGLILGDAVRLVLVGLILGLAASTWLTRWIESLLFGVGRMDWTSFAVVSLMLLSVGVAAAYGPARRASVADPLRALREP